MSESARAEAPAEEQRSARDNDTLPSEMDNPDSKESAPADGASHQELRQDAPKRASFSRRSLIASAAVTGVLAVAAGALTVLSRCDANDAESGALALRTGEEAARENAALLQSAIDAACGTGGVVELPAGTFYFAWTGSSEDGNYVIEMRDGVEVRGAGRDDTILKPLGRYALTGEAPHGIDMFYYDGIHEKRYLTGAVFRDFTIDGESTQGSLRGYNASGKGFFFKLFKDCLWERVGVQNTDGTGFGSDYPVNCTMRDCIAVGCGKNATSSSVGASGFGVGIGYSDGESMVIENCESLRNTKFGFFFEHQSLFRSDYMNALEADGFFVSGCKAWGNLVNFGGNRSYDLVYTNCESDVSSDTFTESYTDYAFRFIDHSVRIVVENAQVNQMYTDMLAGSPHLAAIEWALSNNVAHVGSGENGLFNPDGRITRGETAVFLWRYAGRPGDVMVGDEDIASPADDVASDAYCAEAVRWLKADGLSVGSKFRSEDMITIGEFALLLRRYALLFADDSSQAAFALRYSHIQAPQWATSSAATGKNEQQEALIWAYDEKIISSDDDAHARSFCTRAEAIEMLYAFDCAKRASSSR